MSQQRDVVEQKGPNQVLHIRSDSETKLDELFNAVIHPKDYQVPLTVPMRLRNLPPSFFKQPEKGSKSASNSEETTCRGSSAQGGISSQQATGTKLQINHPRAHSSPATLQQAFNNNTSQHQHLRQQSYDIIDDSTPLPPGWEMAKAPSGQLYFLNHLTQTTTWCDPRKKSEAVSPNDDSSTQNLGSLPKGWEQASTVQGEVYFINHIDRTTTWLDPRIPAHLQNPPVIQTPSIGTPRQVLDNGQLQSISLATTFPAVKSSGTATTTSQLSLQQRQQQLRLQRLQMERERLRIRQQEIIRQVHSLNKNQEMLLRQSMAEEPNSTDLPSVSASLDSFLEGVTDFHSRQESADSGLGLGSNYSLPTTPEDFLNSMDDVEPDCQNTDLGLDLQTSLDLGEENMDSDDLVPSLQAELNADILSDVEALLTSNKDSVLTWL